MINILIVDDESVMVKTIRRGLASRGYRVFEALCAQQALDQLNQRGQRIDLVATDYSMPEMNGIGLLRSIRKNHPTLPVIIMSAYADKNIVIEALNNRCDGFIEKPFSLDQLVDEIDRIKQHAKADDHCQLFPGPAHQIKNFLFTISGSAELILMDRSKSEATQRHAQNIINAVTQINRIFEEVLV